MMIQNNESEQMANDKDIVTLHQRISAMTVKFEKCNSDIVKKLTELHTDVKLIKKTCEHRGETCATHVEEMDKTLRGNGKNGVLVKLAANEQRYKDLEKRGSGKEKFAYLIIGALIAGLFSLSITLIIKLVG